MRKGKVPVSPDGLLFGWLAHSCRFSGTSTKQVVRNKSKSKKSKGKNNSALASSSSDEEANVKSSNAPSLAGKKPVEIFKEQTIKAVYNGQNITPHAGTVWAGEKFLWFGMSSGFCTGIFELFSSFLIMVVQSLCLNSSTNRQCKSALNSCRPNFWNGTFCLRDSDSKRFPSALISLFQNLPRRHKLICYRIENLHLLQHKSSTVSLDTAESLYMSS